MGSQSSRLLSKLYRLKYLLGYDIRDKKLGDRVLNQIKAKRLSNVWVNVIKVPLTDLFSNPRVINLNEELLSVQPQVRQLIRKLDCKKDDQLILNKDQIYIQGNINLARSYWKVIMREDLPYLPVLPISPSRVYTQMNHKIKRVTSSNWIDIFDLRLYPVSYDDQQVWFESDRVQVLSTDEQEIQKRTLLHAQLTEALDRSRIAMTEAKKNGDLSDVGSICIEQDQIAQEIARQQTLPSTSSTQELYARLPLKWGWNLIGGSLVYVIPLPEYD